MFKYVEICFNRNPKEDGFAFECMKTAYQYSIKGRMVYSSGAGITVEAEGESDRISEFIRWISGKNQNCNLRVNQETSIHTGKFKEFDLLRLE
ncbi:MAG: hypothetical protein IPN08_15620 [Bacteroidales bacterium]|nr:hypothetical protein [Bacteroidales bacterium]MBK9358786.1 hypothetical protein [Bacteroidales bacterium]